VTIPVAIRRKAGLRANTEVRFEINRGVVTLRKVEGPRTHGRRLIETMRGKATASLTTDQIMALTRR
jgi:antitoxin PrlF